MSTETHPADKPADDVDVQKDVTVSGYADPDEYPGSRFSDEWRDFANLFTDDKDFWEQTATERETHYISGNGEKVEVDDRTAAKAVVAGNDDLRVITETETSTTYEYPRYKASYAIRDAVTEAMPSRLAGLELDGHQYVTQQSGECICDINASLEHSENVLTHRSERSEENRYESAERVMGITVTFSIGPDDKDTVDVLSEDIIENAQQVVAGLPGIQRVRVAECTETREGDCFV